MRPRPPAPPPPPLLRRRLIVNFSGAINNLFVFPFRALFRAVGQVWRGATVFGQFFSWMFRHGRALLGGGRSAASAAVAVSSTAGVMQRLQNLWNQVLRPIKALGMALYNTFMMLLDKALRHRLTIENWVGARRRGSVVGRFVFSRLTIAVALLSIVLAVLV